MEFFLILVGLFGLIGLLTGIGSNDDSSVLFDDDTLFNDVSFRSSFPDDDDWINDDDTDQYSDDDITDPFCSNLSSGLCDYDGMFSTFGDLYSSDDIITDPTYSFLDCNIYHDDSLD